jgi:Holliday junction resolvasome RuvABC endonuclease subunit
MEDYFSFENCSFHYLTDIKKYSRTFLENIHGEPFSIVESDLSRYDSISGWACDIILRYGCEQVALEGYSYGSKGKVFHIAENTGVLKYKLFQNSIPVDIIPPTTVKKFATGKGNSDKEMMHDSFMAETGKNLKKIITPLKKKASNPVSDIVDSYYICKAFYDKINSVD